MSPPAAWVIWSALPEYILGLSPTFTIEDTTDPVFDFKVILGQIKVISIFQVNINIWSNFQQDHWIQA